MLMRSEPALEISRIAQQLLTSPQAGTWSRPSPMPADVYRTDEEFVIAFDLPGVDPDAIDVEVQRNQLTVRAERRPVDLGTQATVQASERPLGVFSRQLLLSDAVDAEHINASYDNGVLVVRLPISAKAKPRKIAINGRSQQSKQKAIAN